MRLHRSQHLLRNNSYLFFIILICCSCKKEVLLELTEYNTNTDSQLNAIHIFNNHEIVIIGGDTWEPGIKLQSENEGVSWTKTSMHWAGLSSFSTAEINQHIWMSGLNACFYYNENETKLFTPDSFRFYKCISNFISNKAFVVGGEAFKFGYIDAIDSDHGVSTVFQTAHTLSAVWQIDSSTILAGGYGIVVRSSDSGKNWITLDVSGDHFIDFYFINKQVGFLIGHFGSIFKTDDGGITWENLRFGASPFISDLPFRSIFFRNKDEGVIVGDDGLIYFSKDAGISWKQIRTETKANLLDVAYTNGRYWVCGSSGTVISFQL